MNGENRKMNRRELLALLVAMTAGDAAANPSPATPSPATTAADPVMLNPRSYKVMFENDKVRVLEYRSKPGLGVCGQGRHFHPEHLTIVLSAGKVTVRKEGGKPHTVEAHPGKMLWSAEEVHEVENIGGRDMHAYIVEYKNAKWKPSTG